MDLGGVQHDLLMKLLSASSLRARVIANNISNQNVPGFKRQVVRFEELLAAALPSGAELSSGADPASGSDKLLAVEPRIDTDRLTPAGQDGNNVSMELERNAMVENRLLYDTYAQILQTRTDMMRLAIQEGR